MAGLKNNYQFEFTDTLTTSGTSVRISNEKENGAVATFTNQYITVRSEDNSIVERMKGSATGGTLTLTMRGLDQSDTDTEVVGLKKEWREGSKAFVTYVASQHTDAKGNNTFSGTQTFENISVSNNSALTNATVSGKYKGPVVVDVTARDLLYPTPVGGNEVFVQSLNAKQVYNAGTAQRETQAVGTPAPDASETVKGIAEIATQAEVDAGTSDTTIVTPLKLKTQQPEALVDKDTYILGEDCLVNDSLFPETAPTFAESTSVQNIGDVTANTRVVLYDFGSGLSGNTKKLSLRKFTSPSADLSVRLETLNGSGNPTGTLVNANATATVTAASLTTSLVDTTITFAGSFTIPKGQKYAIVLSQVGDVVNGTNYYGIGYVARDTRTRGAKIFNGTTRYTDRPDGSDSIQSFGFVVSASASSGLKLGVKIVPTRNIYITNVTKTATATDTIAYITNSSLTTIVQSNFSGNVATFSPQLLLSGVTYYILTDQGGLTRTFRADNTTTFPLLLNGFDLVAGRSDSGDTTSFIYNIESITIQNQLDAYNVFPYRSSPLALHTVLSKTNATYSYKLPTDFPRFAAESKSAGEEVITAYYGLKDGFSGLSPVTYYASNTPGLISATAGTNVYALGNGIDTTTLKIDGKNLNKGITVGASPFSYTNTTGGPIQVSITGGTVNPIVINGVTTATATNHINTLPSGATMTVTYTVLPTITYSDL